MQENNYGVGDASFQAAGGAAGLVKLADDFYQAMASQPEASDILQMHPQDLEQSRDKLARFLAGWLGGPKLYREKYGPISIPQAHAHLAIGLAERDAWLQCMAQALEKQPYAEGFKQYLLAQLFVPAERCRNQK